MQKRMFVEDFRTARPELTGRLKFKSKALDTRPKKQGGRTIPAPTE
jgi:hypothetical protein